MGSRRTTRPSSGSTHPPSLSSSNCTRKSLAVPGHPVWVSRGRHRNGSSTAPWSSSPTSCPWSRFWIFLCRMVEQLADVMRFFDTLLPVPEQAIEVPKILLDDVPVRTAVRDTQLVEQLAEVPTIISYSSLQRTVEQHVDIPVPRRGGRNAGLQGFPPRQSSTATQLSLERISERIAEQIVDFHVSRGGLQDFRPGQSSSSVARSPAEWLNTEDKAFQGFFSHFPPSSKKKVRSWVRTRVRGCPPVSAHPRWRLSWRSRPCRIPSLLLARCDRMSTRRLLLIAGLRWHITCTSLNSSSFPLVHSLCLGDSVFVCIHPCFSRQGSLNSRSDSFSTYVFVWFDRSSMRCQCCKTRTASSGVGVGMGACVRGYKCLCGCVFVGVGVVCGRVGACGSGCGFFYELFFFLFLFFKGFFLKDKKSNIHTHPLSLPPLLPSPLPTTIATTTTVSRKRALSWWCPFETASSCRPWLASTAQPLEGGQRRLRQFLRHERLSVAVALAESQHHTSRGQKTARAGEEGHEEHDALRRQPELFKSCLRLIGWQVRVGRHFMEDMGNVCPFVQILDLPVRCLAVSGPAG